MKELILKTVSKSVLIGAMAFSVVFSASANHTPLAGLRENVNILTPETAVPTVRASNQLDAAFMTGYLHARDRFFQMDFNRRIASGTLAEMLGDAVIGTDIQLRTLGLRRAAWASYGKYSADSRARLQAYANGVNAYLATSPLPPEYGPLEITMPEPWSPVDSLAIAKLLAWDLSFDSGDVDNSVAIGTYQAVGNAVGFDGTALFFEDTYRLAPPDGRVTVPGFLNSIGGVGKSSAAKAAQSFPELDSKLVQLSRAVQRQFREDPILGPMLQKSASHKGSNWWVASGQVTDSGVPILANDPHLSLDTPSTFYPLHIAVDNSDGSVSNVSGVSFAGAPGIVQGCNDDLCWGSTVNPIDETDYFMEEVRLNTFGLPTHTVFNGVEEPILPVFQSYFSNNVGDGVMDNVGRADVSLDAGGITFVVPRRNNGPIVNIDGTSAISIQYTGWGATLELESFFEINAARNVDEFADALQKFDFGSQNFVVADRRGDIAYFAGGEVPIRSDLQNAMAPGGGVPPVFVRDGTGALGHEWLASDRFEDGQATPTSILPFAEMPQVVNPDSGYIANANNDPVGVSLDNNGLNQVRPGGGLYYLGPGGYASYRMGRIDRLMSSAAERGGISVNDFKAFQANNQMLDAELIVPHILGAFDNAELGSAWPMLAAVASDPQLQEVRDLLTIWNFSTPTGIPEGYDPGDNPFGLTPPGDDEINNSVAATVYSMWRGQMVQNSIDATLSAVGLGDNLPPSRLAFNSLKYMLDTFDQNQGVGASGLNFFTNPDAPDAESARDFLILASLRSALDQLAGDEFAPAFGNSTDVMDYRWGKLHRIVFDHPLNDVFSLPNGLYGLVSPEGLDGIARAGGYEVLDASSHSARADGLNEFMFGSGPARRFVGEIFPDGIVAEQIVPGGQSGVLGNMLYANQLYFWLVNAHLPLFTDANTVEAIAVDNALFGPPSD